MGTTYNHSTKLSYIPEQKYHVCPFVISFVVLNLIYYGFDVKVFHSTPQNGESVNCVEAVIYVVDIEAAAAHIGLDHVIGKRIGDRINVTSAITNFTLIQWNDSMDVTLDNSIEYVAK